jgi:hypothetical protein
MEVGRDLKEAEEEETFYIFTCLFRDVSIWDYMTPNGEFISRLWI